MFSQSETVVLEGGPVRDWRRLEVRMKHSRIKCLDMTKMTIPELREVREAMWDQLIMTVKRVETLEKIEMCRCSSIHLEKIAAVSSNLEYLSVGPIESRQIHLATFERKHLIELKLKGHRELGLKINDARVLSTLSNLKTLSLTVVKNMSEVLLVVGTMTQLESLELGDMTNLTVIEVVQGFNQLNNLKRLRLEKGQEGCPTNAILQTICRLPSLKQLELINFDIDDGFKDSLSLCSNIEKLLLIPTYGGQFQKTNYQVLQGVCTLPRTLKQFTWVMTLELLSETEKVVEDCIKKGGVVGSCSNQNLNEYKGSCAMLYNPITTKVDVMELSRLQHVLILMLPNAQVSLIKTPFKKTWRQTIPI
uniref:Uncharacterized protein n=1 Tax=Cuerna arida TaxID=1464854 RepID=A0A1B6FJY5_9HEMI